MLTLDGHSVILDATPAFLEQYHYRRDQLDGFLIARALQRRTPPPEEIESFDQLVLRPLRAGLPVAMSWPSVIYYGDSDEQVPVSIAVGSVDGTLHAMFSPLAMSLEKAAAALEQLRRPALGASPDLRALTEKISNLEREVEQRATLPSIIAAVAASLHLGAQPEAAPSSVVDFDIAEWDTYAGFRAYVQERYSRGNTKQIVADTCGTTVKTLGRAMVHYHLDKQRDWSRTRGPLDWPLIERACTDRCSQGKRRCSRGKRAPHTLPLPTMRQLGNLLAAMLPIIGTLDWVLDGRGNGVLELCVGHLLK